MRLALGPLRLAPDMFWRMSPCELQAALDGYFNISQADQGSSALSQGEFEALCARFPDQGI